MRLEGSQTAFGAFRDGKQEGQTAYGEEQPLAARKDLWLGLLVDNGQKELGHLPHFQADLDELDRISREVALLRTEQAQALVALREITFKIRTLTKRADRTRGRLGASLRGHFGYDSLDLIRYGFKPRQRVRTRPEEEQVVDAVNAKAGDETPRNKEGGAED